MQVDHSRKMTSMSENTEEMDREEPITEPEEIPDPRVKFWTVLHQFRSQAIREKNNALVGLIDETISKLSTLSDSNSNSDISHTTMSTTAQLSYGQETESYLQTTNWRNVNNLQPFYSDQSSSSSSSGSNGGGEERSHDGSTNDDEIDSDSEKR